MSAARAMHEDGNCQRKKNKTIIKELMTWEQKH
jgi:hypothetical protein